MVWIQAQYKEDGVYKWTPSESDYYFSKETNVDKVERTIKEDDIELYNAFDERMQTYYENDAGGEAK